MTKILVLGGAGVEGSTVALDLAKSGIEEIVLADYNLEGAKKIAQELQKSSNSNVKAVKVDANQHEELVNLLKDENPDVVCNLIGPYYKYGEPIVKAAIEARVPYVDINDDFKPTLAVFENLNDKAKEANIPVFIGIGVSPGLTNMFAKHASTQLDQTDSISVIWLWPALAGGGVGVVRHLYNILQGNGFQYLDGKYSDLPAGTNKLRVTSKDGKYDEDVYFVSHAETATLSKFIDGVKNVTVHGGLIPTEATELYFKLMEAGMDDAEPITVNGKNISLIEVSMSMMERKFKDVDKAKNENGYFKVTVEGKKDGLHKKFIYELDENGADETTWPASIIAQSIAEGSINAIGLHPAEGLSREQIDIIFDKLRAKGFTINISEE
ncbi:MAG: saccharopine dehydrogenase family protein [Bacillota bacterium]|jgi:saccharopine dehydrogenase-like NADP-dependent oxidoreductase